MVDQEKLDIAHSIIKQDEKERIEGFNKELEELKKKWKVEQKLSVIDQEYLNNVLEALSKTKINIVTHSL